MPEIVWPNPPPDASLLQSGQEVAPDRSVRVPIALRGNEHVLSRNDGPESALLDCLSGRPAQWNRRGLSRFCPLDLNKIAAEINVGPSQVLQVSPSKAQMNGEDEIRLRPPEAVRVVARSGQSTRATLDDCRVEGSKKAPDLVRTHFLVELFLLQRARPRIKSGSGYLAATPRVREH